MARSGKKSKIRRRRALTCLLFIVAAGLVADGAVQLRHDYFVTGTQLIGWAFVPLTIALVFTWPVQCRALRTDQRKACGNWAYGLLFGCSQSANHRIGKFKARLHFGSGEVKPVQRQRQTVPSVALHQPVSESKPIKVTVEDNGLGVCGFWVGVVSAVAGVIQVVTYFVH